jgi:hypothetical protein
VRTSSYLLSFVATAFLAALPIRVKSGEIPAVLRKNAECMLKVLNVTPGVSEPRLGSDDSHGWNHPFLEYRATEGLRGSQLMRFDAQKSADGPYARERRVLEHIEMPARKQPFTGCGNLAPDV